MKKIIFIALAAVSIVFNACNKDNTTPLEPASYLLYTSWIDSLVGAVDLKNGNTIDVFSKGTASGIEEQGVESIALNTKNGDIYISTSSNPNDKIYKLNSSGVATLFYSGDETGSLANIAYDSTNNRLIWLDGRTNKIYYKSVTGSDDPASLFGDDDINATGEALAIDGVNGKIYFSGGLNIYVGNLDGTGTPSVLYSAKTETLKLPRGIVLDVENNRLYYADEDEELIGVANLDGTGNFKILFRVPGGAPYGLAVDFVSKKIYWSDIYSLNKRISVGNLNGSGTPAILVNNIYSYGILLL